MRLWSSIALSAAICCVSTAALAHASLIVSDPSDGATLAVSPATMTLQFSEGLEAAFSHITLLSQTGEPIGTTGETIGGSGDRALSATPAQPLRPGQYTIKWDVLSKDGHKTGGTRSFTVTP